MAERNWTTYGPVRGQCGHRHTYAGALACCKRDAIGCQEQGGYSDRWPSRIDSDGFLADDDGDPIWPPHGRSTGAVRFEGVTA